MEKRYLKYTFTPEEITEKSKLLAHECRLLAEAEDEKKEVASQIKARIDTHSATISRLASDVNNGYEYRNVDVRLVQNTPVQGKKTIVRADSGEAIAVEAMTAEELQLTLQLNMDEEAA